MTEEEKVRTGDITFSQYFNDKIAWTEKFFQIQIEQLDEKARLLREGMEHRLIGLNENRQRETDIRHTLITRVEWSNELAGIKEALQQLRTFKDGIQALATQKAVNYSYMLSVIAIFVSIVSVIIKFAK